MQALSMHPDARAEPENAMSEPMWTLMDRARRSPRELIAARALKLSFKGEIHRMNSSRRCAAIETRIYETLFTTRFTHLRGRLHWPAE